MTQTTVSKEVPSIVVYQWIREEVSSFSFRFRKHVPHDVLDGVREDDVQVGRRSSILGRHRIARIRVNLLATLRQQKQARRRKGPPPPPPVSDNQQQERVSGILTEARIFFFSRWNHTRKPNTLCSRARDCCIDWWCRKVEEEKKNTQAKLIAQ